MALLSDKFKLKPQLSGADIKSLYEAQPDTNAFTDTDKTKLIGIESGAEVNVNADWSAVSGDAQILNKPTLGTAAATNSTDYATAAQGTLADTALQPDQAETVSGDYTFNGALILPNNSRINNIEHFYQTTKPTARGDSSALVVGDRWWKTDDGTEWFWNGTYWLGTTLYSDSAVSKGLTHTNNYFSLFAMGIPPGQPFFIQEIYLKWVYTNYTVTDYWQLQATVQFSQPDGTLSSGTYTTTAAEGTYRGTRNVYSANTNGTVGVRGWVLKVGNPGNITELTETILWRLAA